MADYIKNKYDKNVRILLHGNGWLVDDTNDAQITVNSVYVGTVAAGGGYPTTRMNGEPLADGDYVKVDPSSPLPFTLGDVTFNTVNDQALWDELNQTWVYDPSSSRETAGVVVSHPGDEDYPTPSSTAAYVQQDINMHFKYWIEWLIEAIKRAGYTFTLDATDVDSNRTLEYTLYDKEGLPISTETWENFLLNTRKVAGSDLVDDITPEELENALKNVEIVYQNKHYNADQNYLTNVRVANMSHEAVTDSTEISDTTHWTDFEVPTTKAICEFVGVDIEAVYNNGKTDESIPKITVQILNSLGFVIDETTIEISNPIVDAQYLENGISKDNSMKIIYENNSYNDIELTNVVITDHEQTLTNKVIDADNNNISNLEVDNFKVNTEGSAVDGVIVTEINDGEDDTMLPTAKAVYDYATYQIDGEIKTDENVLEVALQDKNGVDKERLIFHLQNITNESTTTVDGVTTVHVRLVDDDGELYSETEFDLLSDILVVDALPSPTGARPDKLYTVKNESPSALRWSDGFAWYDLADTNGIVTVTNLPSTAIARQDCLYHEAATNKLYWFTGSEFVMLDESAKIHSIPMTWDTDKTELTLKMFEPDATLIASSTVEIVPKVDERTVVVDSNNALTVPIDEYTIYVDPEEHALKSYTEIDGSTVVRNDSGELSVPIDNDTIQIDEDTALIGIDMDTIFKKLYPIGSIYMSVNDSPPDFGTWVAWGSGRVPVGVDTGSLYFATVEKTGGEDKVALTRSLIPDHAHSTTCWYDDANYNHGTIPSSGSRYSFPYDAGSLTRTFYLPYDGYNGGGGDAPKHNNLQPYITCYMFKRTG